MAKPPDLHSSIHHLILSITQHQPPHPLAPFCQITVEHLSWCIRFRGVSEGSLDLSQYSSYSLANITIRLRISPLSFLSNSHFNPPTSPLFTLQPHNILGQP